MKRTFSERFEIVYKNYTLLVENIGSKPSEAGFARFLNVSQTTMQRWKKGQIPAAKDIKTIHDKLGFSYGWLIDGEGEMFDSSAQKIEALEREVKRLQTERFMEGTASQDCAAGTGRAAGQE